MVLNWDIFCRVVDNFGDAGVCWRLARSLQETYGQKVRLWLDDLAPLEKLCPDYTRYDVVVRRWQAPFTEDLAEMPQVVVEAFACELPEIYLDRLAQPVVSCSLPPVWINLEYLSAETWIEGCHGLASPHPRSGTSKYFFFPGFTERTGGLLWGAPPRLVAATQPPLSQVQVAKKTADPATCWVSLFCYDHLPVDGLLAAWRDGKTPIWCWVPPGKPRQCVEKWLGRGLVDVVTTGKLVLCPLPFLSQVEYDQLLLRCDLNFVRGEDSFVRAQWAGKPFIWQIYPQAEQAHQDKLSAFLACYTAELPEDLARLLRYLHELWNGIESEPGESLGWDQVWAAFSTRMPDFQRHAADWAKAYHDRAAQGDDLVGRLVKFVGENRRLSV